MGIFEIVSKHKKKQKKTVSGFPKFAKQLS